ncbi:uncharacterized protein LOC120014086 [Tripterygium wilfordii]|uniref:uncharacterized protein LOC120000605 n=1 Tax=Tripterygium wilfordii TaxID=458696 RepID=UPI0018F84F8F|nr:uncharacterized protein LOC120000605 [Tripterygium wilfordii]XP_038704679.1 uncharacterized protein LOC120000628 [Tripterygium wilfordii]XP_038708596.1 uncharacterized protein LOC120003654 [Tripterygium wilfordii]XP_038721941.1 uncharacterized protein LOC120014086 [Tripterygium wilfordii]
MADTSEVTNSQLLQLMQAMREDMSKNKQQTDARLESMSVDNAALREEVSQLRSQTTSQGHDPTSVRIPPFPRLEQTPPPRDPLPYPLSAQFVPGSTPGGYDTSTSRGKGPATEEIQQNVDRDAPVDLTGSPRSRLPQPPRFPAAPFAGPTIASVAQAAMAKQIIELRGDIDKLTKAPPALAKINANCYTGSPFVDSIYQTDLPHRFSVPSMKLYNGTDDPEDHVAHYKLKMGAIAIPYGMHETCMCKGFGSTLTGPALRWYINLPNGSIASFEKLIETFMVQFSSSRKIHKCSDDLYRLPQRVGESLRDFLSRFNTEKVSIPYCDPGTTIQALRSCLLPDGEFYEELTKCDVRSYEEALMKATVFVRWEEDARRKPVNPPKEEKREDKRPRKDQSTFGEPSSNWRSRKSGASDYAKNCPEYPLKIHQVEAVQVLKKMGSEVKWPPKKETEGWKDPKKWCDFHQDIGHTTPDCRGLRYEVDYLLKRGHLRELLSEHGRAIWEKRKVDDPEALPLPPPITQTYCVISGGSEISGLSHTSAKKHEKEAANPAARMARSLGTFTNQVMVFTDDEATQLLHPHHDALVLTLQVANINLKRILIDNGSSANVLFLAAYKGMGLDETLILRKSMALIGFNGEVSHSVGEVVLPIYAPGLNKQTRFSIVDSPSAYNAILGRPWLHAIRAVPSTYHQILRYPTNNGVREILGDQHSSRSCYKTTMRSKGESS